MDTSKLNSIQSQAKSYQEITPLKKYINYFNLYRRKYTEKFNNQWITKEQYLKDLQIYNHIIGKSVIGYFLTYAADIFGFDIDNHSQKEKGKLNLFEQDILLLAKYNFLINHFGLPAVVFRSSSNNGLHCYYKLESKYPFIVIQQTIKNKLDRLPKGFEILPTTEHSLRLPFAIKEGGLLLDDQTLQPIKIITLNNLVEILETADKKHFSEIFDCYPSQFLLKAKTKRKQYKNLQALKRLEIIEQKLFPIQQGASERNEKLERLAYAYYCTGLDTQEASGRIRDNMRGIGLDYQQERIEKQLACHFERFERNKVKYRTQERIIKRERQLDLFLEQKINDFVNQRVFSNNTKSLNSLRHFLIELYNWKAYITGLSNSDRIYLDFVYPYFWHNTKNKGLIPLPRVLLIKWYQHYWKILNFLKSKGIVELKQQYSNKLGVCKYFNVNNL